ncbi:calmodulin-like protein 4 [Astyanax mexicanus]|uniref:Calmodulin-like protein 4 n=2 Tax=Astyanax mexicanus TaxID=7994 RepID=A0A8T2MG84_ASTMX|nr:calmodulin-like protein 4 [Astyanax mexicanus]KAG9280842.1 calmodulin-like protein 4 [Astyanax mexicanus]
MAKFLSHDQITEFKECFSLYDKKHKGKIKAQDLITVMRCLGCSPTLMEVDRHLKRHNIDKCEELDFSTFLTIMYEQLQQENPEAEILQALSRMDKQKNGYVLASELRATLRVMGEKLTDQEVDELFREAGVGDDENIHYEEFAKMVTLQSTRC